MARPNEGDGQDEHQGELRFDREAEVSDAEVERQRRRLLDVSVDGGGSIGAAEDGRARSQPEGDGEERPRRMDSRGEEERRRREESLRHERERLTRR